MQLFLFFLPIFLQFALKSQVNSVDLQEENDFLKLKILALENKLVESEKLRLYLHNELDDRRIQKQLVEKCSCLNHNRWQFLVDSIKEANFHLHHDNKKYKAFIRYKFSDEHIPQELADMKSYSLIDLIHKANHASARFEKLLSKETVPASLVFDKSISLEHYTELMRTSLANLESLRATVNNIMIGFNNRSDCVRDLVGLLLMQAQTLQELFNKFEIPLDSALIKEHQQFLKELTNKYPTSFIPEETVQKWLEKLKDLNKAIREL